eukprot:6935219-Ditylum_brightwellii.AAC.1
MQLIDANILAMPKMNTPWTKQVQTICYQYGHKICGSFKYVEMSRDVPTGWCCNFWKRMHHWEDQ